MYYQFTPEVAGGWGEGTEADTTCHPPKVKKLVYEFDGWLGDSIVASFPCYLVTEDLAQSINNSKLSGYELVSCKIKKSEIFDELYPNRKLPMFLWFKIIGKAGVDDFGIGANLRLVVSDEALAVLKKHSINGSKIEEFNV